MNSFALKKVYDGCTSDAYCVTRFLMASVRGIARIAPIEPRTQLQNRSDRIIVRIEISKPFFHKPGLNNVVTHKAKDTVPYANR